MPGILRGILFFLILSLIIIFVVGYGGVTLNLLPENIANYYTEHFSFVTGLASVIGLLALASSRKIKTTDFESEEIEKFQSILKATKELEEIEQNKSQTTIEIQDLERKRKVMEISVKKAGLVLFYREQLRKSTEVALNKIESDDELKSAIEEFTEASSKLVSLEEEIELDDNVEIIRDLLNFNKLSLEDDRLSLAGNTASEIVLETIKNVIRLFLPI